MIDKRNTNVFATESEYERRSLELLEKNVKEIRRLRFAIGFIVLGFLINSSLSKMNYSSSLGPQKWYLTR